MLAVLMLFLIPVGGGIPAGVLLARSKGLAWPVTAGLYFISDVILAFVFEPILRLLVLIGRRFAFMARLSAAMTLAMHRTAAHYGGRSAGPFMLILIAFGVDPMTGRSAALAAGHGFVAGWAIAIAGDMLYYGVIAFTTLRLDAYFEDPNTTMWIVLAAMILVPIVVRRVRAAWSRTPASGSPPGPGGRDPRAIERRPRERGRARRS
jgi:hypothetical protein